MQPQQRLGNYVELDKDIVFPDRGGGFRSYFCGVPQLDSFPFTSITDDVLHGGTFSVQQHVGANYRLHFR